jgi:hypothetical protein
MQADWHVRRQPALTPTPVVSALVGVVPSVKRRAGFMRGLEDKGLLLSDPAT